MIVSNTGIIIKIQHMKLNKNSYNLKKKKKGIPFACLLGNLGDEKEGPKQPSSEKKLILLVILEHVEHFCLIEACIQRPNLFRKRSSD